MYGYFTDKTDNSTDIDQSVVNTSDIKIWQSGMLAGWVDIRHNPGRLCMNLIFD